MPSRPSTRLQLMLVALLIAFVAPKGALSAGRSLQATLTTCKAPVDVCHCMDMTTTYSGDVRNAVAATIKSFDASTARHFVSSSHNERVYQQTSTPRCYGDQSDAIACAWAAKSGSGKPHHSNCIKDCLTRFDSSTDRKKKIILYGNNPESACTPSERQNAIALAKSNNVDVHYMDLACTTAKLNPNLGNQLCSGPSYYVPSANAATLVSGPMSGWSTKCGGWFVQPAQCPLKCRETTTLNILAKKDKYGNFVCNVLPCTGTSIGTSCYQVYESGLSGTATLKPSLSSMTVDVGQTLPTYITITASNGQASCNGTVIVNCQLPGPSCKTDSECADEGGKYPVPITSVCTASRCVNGFCKYVPALGTCDDGNACTGSPPGPHEETADPTDQCDGINMGYAGCTNPSRNGVPTTIDCSTSPPPAFGSLCYDMAKGATCNKADGKCFWQLSATAINNVISANSYCGTWAAGFAGQISSGNTTIAGGSTAASRCYSSCNTGSCAAFVVPSCTCLTAAASYSMVQVGTRPPCPSELSNLGQTPTQTGTVFDCKGVAPVTSSTTNGSLCWVPDSQIKNGGPGSFADCNGTSLTQYQLTGGSSSSQCMGCLGFGYAYSANSSRCFAANQSAPVDPNTPH